MCRGWFYIDEFGAATDLHRTHGRSPPGERVVAFVPHGHWKIISTIGLKARHNKNKQNGELPIPSDLAAARKVYVAGLDPYDVVFPFPSTSGSIVDMLRRDLDGAGVRCRRR